MKSLIELHILQSYAPSNLNRDDTGAPKDAIFGGARRARISSQCLKRAARTYMAEQEEVHHDELAVRTKRVSAELAKRLGDAGQDIDIAARVAEVALGGAGFSVEDGKTQYLFFLSRAELDAMAKAIDTHWDELVRLVPDENDDANVKDAKKRKKAAQAKVPSEIRSALEAAFDQAKAVDLALFGRMLADRPERNQDAACQVAHAISTHKVDLEYDYYTAVDDNQPDDSSGADMIGTVEFNSATYYRYLALDVHKLVENLGGDTSLALRGLGAFLRANILAEPSGKQNSFAAHNPPSYIAATVRSNASPRSLANAFERPVRARGDQGLLHGSVQALEAEWAKMDHAYGQSGVTRILDLTGAGNGEVVATASESVDDVVRETVSEARASLEL